MKVFYTGGQGHPIVATAELVDLLPGIEVVEIQRNRGDRREFREFYIAVTAHLQDLMTSREPPQARRSLPERPCLSRKATLRHLDGTRSAHY